jgi:hypothetical protein
MSFTKSLGWVVALGAMFLPVAAAQAELVTYITSGIFDGGDAPGTSTYTDLTNGISIAFTSSGTQVADITSGPTLATFGTFDTSLTTATSNVPVTSGFTLSIFQIDPAPNGPLTFLGALSGSLSFGNSGASVQFSGPLTQSLGSIFYQIVSADDGFLGRVNLSPPSLNNGQSTISGRVGSVPEPSTLVLMGIGAPALVAVRYRKKKKENVAV